jgi:hypothetical protein
MAAQKRKDCQPPIAERVVFALIGFKFSFPGFRVQTQHRQFLLSKIRIYCEMDIVLPQISN